MESISRKLAIACGLTLCASVLALAQVTTQPADLRALYSVDPANWPAANWLGGVERNELAAVPDVVHPLDNPHSREKEELGRRLFWDGRLSGSLGVACVSCHHPDLGWSDGKTTSQGHHLRLADRNAPGLLGVGHKPRLMWDGRSDSLEAQAMLPLANEKEMHADFAQVEARVNAIEGYRKQFKSVFGVEQITVNEISRAIATFQRTLNPGRSRFDSFMSGKYDVLSDAEIRGLHLFRTTANCINCHSGPLLTDNRFHNIGLSYYGRKFEDLGRYNITKFDADVGAFKTPSLRNVTRTAPYMHNGLFELEGVINIYNAGGFHPEPTDAQKDDPLFPKTSGLLKELNLSEQDKKDLQSFLTALEEPRTRIRTPDLPQ
jgi:cytochrome c peroxidase